MMLDKDLELSLAQAVTASAASTNVINLGAAGDAYVAPFVLLACREAATASGAGTLTFTLQTSVDEAFTSPITLFTSPTFALADMTLNAELLKVRIPSGCKKYVRGYYTVATGPLTAGKFDLLIANDVKTGAQ
jgi:hypothetical protein